MQLLLSLSFMLQTPDYSLGISVFKHAALFLVFYDKNHIVFCGLWILSSATAMYSILLILVAYPTCPSLAQSLSYSLYVVMLYPSHCALIFAWSKYLWHVVSLGKMQWIMSIIPVHAVYLILGLCSWLLVFVSSTITASLIQA